MSDLIKVYCREYDETEDKDTQMKGETEELSNLGFMLTKVISSYPESDELVITIELLDSQLEDGRNGLLH